MAPLGPSPLVFTGQETHLSLVRFFKSVVTGDWISGKCLSASALLSELPQDRQMPWVGGGSPGFSLMDHQIGGVMSVWVQGAHQA